LDLHHLVSGRLRTIKSAYSTRWHRRAGLAQLPGPHPACRLAYERDGQTFTALADWHGVGESTRRKLLRSFGVEPRPRGKKLGEVEMPDLVIADWRAGLSCWQIASKHGLADHKPVVRVLRSRGIDLHSRPSRRKISPTWCSAAP
jgi:hypothetical protein